MSQVPYRLRYAAQRLIALKVQKRKIFEFAKHINPDEAAHNKSLCLDSQHNKAWTKQGPVVQSIVSLTSSLRGQLVKCFTTL